MDDRAGIQAAATCGVNVIRTPAIYRLAKAELSRKSVRSSTSCAGRGFGCATDHYRMIVESLDEMISG